MLELFDGKTIENEHVKSSFVVGEKIKLFVIGLMDDA